MRWGLTTQHELLFFIIFFKVGKHDLKTIAVLYKIEWAWIWSRPPFALIIKTKPNASCANIRIGSRRTPWPRFLFCLVTSYRPQPTLITQGPRPSPNVKIGVRKIWTGQFSVQVKIIKKYKIFLAFKMILKCCKKQL